MEAVLACSAEAGVSHAATAGLWRIGRVRQVESTTLRVTSRLAGGGTEG